jgi:sec-independent protein translocase protein TatB
MDSFFGIGFPELVFILILAGLVMGPHRIRHVARTLGRLVAQMQAVSRQFTRQLNAELDALDSPELKGAMEDMKALRREVDDLRRQVRAMPQELAREGRGEFQKAVDEGKRAFKPVSRQAPASEGPADETASGKPPNGEGQRTQPPVPALESLPKPIDVADDPE